MPSDINSTKFKHCFGVRSFESVTRAPQHLGRGEGSGQERLKQTVACLEMSVKKCYVPLHAQAFVLGVTGLRIGTGCLFMRTGGWGGKMGLH